MLAPAHPWWGFRLADRWRSVAGSTPPGTTGRMRDAEPRQGPTPPGPALRRSYDPTTARSLSSNQLLQTLDRIVVVDTGRPGCGAERGCDLVVAGVLLNPQQEDLPLKPR